MHHSSVFTNSCLKVPVDPISKMPKTAYERKQKRVTGQCSVDSVSTTCSVSTADVDAEKLKDFYRSIPDYNDINHLPSEQFYSTLKSLREKKKIMLGMAVEHISDCNGHGKALDSVLSKPEDETLKQALKKTTKSKYNYGNRRKYSADKADFNNTNDGTIKSSYNTILPTKITGSVKRPSRKCAYNGINEKFNDDLKLTPDITSPNKETLVRAERPKRNQSACSISWNDAHIESKTEIDQKFDQFFDGKKYSNGLSKVDIGDDFKTQSMPSSPLRMKRAGSPSRRRKSITIPKPFKMTER